MSRVFPHSLILSLTVLWAFAGHAQNSKDSIWVRGGMLPAHDTIALEMDWRLDSQIPKLGADTLWRQVSRYGELTAWARTDSTQVQMLSLIHI